VSLRRAALLLIWVSPSLAQAGTFVFADEANPDSITHPIGYVGVGGPRMLSVCLRTATLPTGVSATQVENTVLKAVATWNAQRVAVSNLGNNAANDIPAGQDFESVLLHEMGHCLGLAHPNHASESALAAPLDEGTKSTDGINNVFNQAAGVDAIHGSADDVRGDDGNLYWYRDASNDPLAFPATIDASTFRLSGGLPAGQLFARNGDRDVLNAMGVANTESVMQQGQFSDEAQRRLTAEDLSTIRLGAAGLDEIQGTLDDYTIQLNYVGQISTCDLTVEFGGTGFASCAVAGQGIIPDHVRISSAQLMFSPTVTWFFSQAPNTTTTITADTPDPSMPGASYSVSASVAVNTAAPVGPATGQVEIRDDLGTTCLATLSAGSGSCNLIGASNGTRTLRATYLGFRGFDSSTSATASHVVTSSTATLTIIDSPATSVVGQLYTVSANVAGSSGTPTGTVAIEDGRGATCNITLSAGSGSCQLATTSIASPLTLTGNYSGNATYSPSSDTEPHSVNAAATSTSIVSRTPVNTVAGQPYSVSIAVAVTAPGAGSATGSVAVNDGNGQSCNATLTAGAGSCSLTSVATGSLTLGASYAGTTNFSSSSTTTTHQVSKANTTLTIISDAPDASTPGQDVEVVFTLAAVAPGTGTPSGSVTIAVSGGAETCVATLPQTRCSLALNQVGARTLTASYGGDARFNSSADEEAHSVAGAGSILTIASDTPDPSTVGDAVTVNFSVAPQAPALGVPGGSVTVTASGGSESCNATLPATSCIIVLNATGARTLTATYSGDANFTPDTGTEAHNVAATGVLFADGFE